MVLALHEFAIATSLVEALLDIAKKEGSGRVLKVHLRIGKLRVVSIDQLKFSYGILSKGTALEGSQLSVEETLGEAKCPNCDHAEKLEPHDMSFHFGIPPMNCPKCETPMVIEGGDEFLITKVRMVAPSGSERHKIGPTTNAVR